MLKVFLSYTTLDRDLVLPYYDRLLGEGFAPWMDVKSILPGQVWEQEIQRAFNSADVVILFLSKRAVEKRGFIQREAKDAIEKARYGLWDDITVIPVLLDACMVPQQISEKFQYVELPKGWGKVLASLQIAAKQRDIIISAGAEQGPFRVFVKQISETWQGMPGYSFDIEFPRFESASALAVSEELNALLNGRAIAMLQDARRARIEQDEDRFTYAEGLDPAYSSFESAISIVTATEELLSLSCVTHGFYAGGAHGNINFETFNFYIDGESVIQIQIQDLFSDYEALKEFSAICQRELIREFEFLGEGAADESTIQAFERGAGPDWDNFIAFTLSAAGISVKFPPYQLLGWAMGPWFIDVPLQEIEHLLDPKMALPRLLRLKREAEEAKG